MKDHRLVPVPLLVELVPVPLLLGLVPVPLLLGLVPVALLLGLVPGPLLLGLVHCPQLPLAKLLLLGLVHETNHVRLVSCHDLNLSLLAHQLHRCTTGMRVGCHVTDCT